MRRYKVKVEPDALADIQEITDWYNEKQKDLGKRFQNATIRQIITSVHHHINLILKATNREFKRPDEAANMSNVTVKVKAPLAVTNSEERLQIGDSRERT